jgi:hypothetical protein
MNWIEIDLEGIVVHGALEISDKLNECRFFLGLMKSSQDWAQFALRPLNAGVGTLAAPENRFWRYKRYATIGSVSSGISLALVASVRMMGSGCQSRDQ